MAQPVTIFSVRDKQPPQPASDIVAIEEPLQIRLRQANTETAISITMRTPGHDAELAIGFLFTEGIIESYADVLHISQPEINVVVVTVADSVRINSNSLTRNFYTTSSCGVCGKASLDAVRVKYTSINANVTIATEIIHQLPALARTAQHNFHDTGGSHASSLFSVDGRHLLTREDVGRHNALDKVIGHCFQHDVNMRQCVLLVSGRASFELIQKAAVAGIPVVCAIGAPSSLAVALANEAGITLIGFLKADRFNVYSHPNRIQL